MKSHRYVFAALTALGLSLAGLAQSGQIPAIYVVWIVFAAGLINGFLHIVNASSVDPAPAPATPKPPPIPPAAVLCLAVLALVLAACSASKNQAAETAVPDCAKCAIEVVTTFAVRAPDGGVDASEGGAK